MGATTRRSVRIATTDVPMTTLVAAQIMTWMRWFRSAASSVSDHIDALPVRDRAGVRRVATVASEPALEDPRRIQTGRVGRPQHDPNDLRAAIAELGNRCA